MVTVARGSRLTKDQKAPSEGEWHAGVRTLQDEEASLAKVGAIGDRMLKRCWDWLETHTDDIPEWVVNTWRFVARQMLELAKFRREGLKQYQGDIGKLDDESLANELRRMVEHEVQCMDQGKLDNLLRLRSAMQVRGQAH